LVHIRLLIVKYSLSLTSQWRKHGSVTVHKLSTFTPQYPKIGYYIEVEARQTVRLNPRLPNLVALQGRPSEEAVLLTRRLKPRLPH